MHKVLVKLDKFQRTRREVSINLEDGLVDWKNHTYRIEYVNQNGVDTPYVITKEIKPLSEIKNDIRTAIEHKINLKHDLYMMDGHSYQVTGIGPDAIQAFKDNDNKPKYFRYGSTEGQYLLEVLLKSINQSVLIELD